MLADGVIHYTADNIREMRLQKATRVFFTVISSWAKLCDKSGRKTGRRVKALPLLTVAGLLQWTSSLGKRCKKKDTIPLSPCLYSPIPAAATAYLSLLPGFCIARESIPKPLLTFFLLTRVLPTHCEKMRKSEQPSILHHLLGNLAASFCQLTGWQKM